jgi:hypothetical protein
VSLPVVGNLGGGFCLFSKTEARAVMGALILTAGGLVLLVGTLILASYGLRASGAAKAASDSVKAVPGAGAAGAKIASAGRQAAASRRERRAPRPGRAAAGPAETLPPTVQSQQSLPARKRAAQPKGPRQVPAKLAGPPAKRRGRS